MHGCRIGKIRLRSGAEVRVLDSWTSRATRACRENFRASAQATLNAEPAMSGYFMVAWGGDTVTDHLRVFEGSKRGIFDIPEFVKQVAAQRVTSKLATGAHDSDDGEAS